MLEEQEYKQWIADNPEQFALLTKSFALVSREELEEYEFFNPITNWTILKVAKYCFQPTEYHDKSHSKVIILLKNVKGNVYRIGELCDDWSFSEIPESWAELLLATLPEFIEHVSSYTEDKSISNT